MPLPMLLDDDDDDEPSFSPPEAVAVDDLRDEDLFDDDAVWTDGLATKAVVVAEVHKRTMPKSRDEINFMMTDWL